MVLKLLANRLKRLQLRSFDGLFASSVSHDSISHEIPYVKRRAWTLVLCHIYVCIGTKWPNLMDQ